MKPFATVYVRVAIVWIAMLLIWSLLAVARDVIWGAGADGYTLGGHVMSAVLTTALAVPVVILARRAMDRDSVGSLGLRLDRAAVSQFVIGATAFLVPSAIGFAIVLALGWVTITPIASWAEILAFVPLLVVLVFLYEALPEELAFRGYMQTNLATRLSYWTTIIVQAVLFSLWGTALWLFTSGELMLDRLVIFFFMAFLLGILRATTGSVWTTIGFHVAFQTVAQLLLNTARGHFVIEGTDMMQLVALGIVPFSLAAIIVDYLSKRGRPDSIS